LAMVGLVKRTLTAFEMTESVVLWQREIFLYSLVVFQVGKILLFIPDNGDPKSVISSAARNLSCSLQSRQN